MTRHPASVPKLFARHVIRDIRVDHPSADARAISAAIENCLSKDNRRVNESVYYYALCERAWLHWSREALDFITTQALKQPTHGAYNPPQVRSAEDAAAAQQRCALHLQLLDFASARMNDSDCPWRFEAARHVNAATEKALAIAAKTDSMQMPNALALCDGVAHAADALTAAIRGGFIEQPVREAEETMRSMLSSRRAASAPGPR